MKRRGFLRSLFIGSIAGSVGVGIGASDITSDLQKALTAASGIDHPLRPESLDYRLVDVMMNVERALFFGDVSKNKKKLVGLDGIVNSKRRAISLR